MPSPNESQESTAARERGNGFYRRGLFAKAEEAYREAAALAPKDPAPWSNISAIKFEQGDYKTALDSIEKALSLSAAEPDSSPKKQKLYARMAKCHLLSLSLDDAEKPVNLLLDDSSGHAMRATLKDMHKIFKMSGEGELRQQVLDRLPRYKGQLQDRPEYYAVGQDRVYPLWDEPLQHAVGPRGDVSFLLCGSGDARHLFATMMSLSISEGMGQRKGMSFNKAHFTILDLNATALARTLVIFGIVIQYICMRAAKLPRIEDALTVMSYIYSSAVVPAFVAEKLEEHVKLVIDELEGEGDVLEMFFIPRDTRYEIIKKLKHWIQPLGDDYAPKNFRPAVLNTYLRAEQHRKTLFGETAPSVVKESPKEFRELGVLFAGDTFIGRREPALRPLLDAFRSDVQGAKQALEGYIDSHWKTNPTLLDMDYERRREEEIEPGASRGKLATTFELDPARLMRSLWNLTRSRPEDGNVLENLDKFFEVFATATMTLLQRVQIEAIAGEMVDTLERIRYDSLEHRSQKPQKVGAIDATQFPRQYDRIHMSNIPDYVGGPLTALLHGGPLLREDRPSNLRFNNLLNPPMFETHDQFLTEYMLMHDAKQVADHFGLVKKEETGKPMLDPIAKMIGNQFMVEDYFVWARSGIKKTPWSRLMARPALEKWLHSHLLKICLPYRRPLWSDRPVHAPLNLTAFFRIVARLHEVGYPAHWLAGVLASICEGSITTTARFPRKLVLHPNDLETSYPQRRISLGPWKAEFTTLLSLWRRLLPFGIVTSAGTLVNPVEVLECSIVFPKFIEKYTRAPHFNVAFINMTIVGPRRLNLPGLLQDDEEGDGSDYAKRLREEGVHMITAFKYVTDTRTATCWLRKDAVEEMMRQDSWNACICRTDSWEAITATATPVSRSLQLLGSWTTQE
ncbi:putative tetratricopeptide [Colletotrichum sublineola]|uniref:Putative tetratricopeptide n=1 Tax=Colletotrichum sublineola TaxID=1173701 RepID=A0A066XJZ1_COLSU|nr:putative tetratricopeptide [Colletotrichum sublineola]